MTATKEKEPSAICGSPVKRHACKQALYHWFCVKKGYCKFKVKLDKGEG